MSNNWNKTIKLACKPKTAAPKTKYLDPIIAATYSEDNSLRDIFVALADRLRNQPVVVTHKALIVLHTMIRSGQTDNVLRFLSDTDVFTIGHMNPAQPPSENLQKYAVYLEARIRAYRDRRHDAIRTQGEANSNARNNTSTGAIIVRRRMRQMTVESGLFLEMKAIRPQLNALLQCKFFLDSLEDELNLATLALLARDLLVLFQANNEGIINILEHYFEMHAVDAEEGLAMYKIFCAQVEEVVDYLTIIRKLSSLLNIPIPNLKHAPTKLAGPLEEYLRDPDFERNRIEYMTNKAFADGKAPNKLKPYPRKEEPATTEPTSASSNVDASTMNPQFSPMQPMIDFSEFMEVVNNEVEQMVSSGSASSTTVLQPADSSRTQAPNAWNTNEGKQVQIGSNEPVGPENWDHSTFLKHGQDVTPTLENLMMNHTPLNLTGYVVIPDRGHPAHGGLADVHAGWLGDIAVAVKIFRIRKSRRTDAEGEASNERRVRREMHVWAALKHPNICEFLGYSTNLSDYPAMVSKWCLHGTATDYLDGQKPSTHERLKLALDVSEGLRYLHNLKIVHGDLKPNNILIDESFSARLCDFGLVRLVDFEGPAGMTTTSPYTGTERYKAPELFISAENRYPVATFEGDIYSLGSVMLEFIELLYPFQRFKRAELRNAIMEGYSPALRSESSGTLLGMTDFLWGLLEVCWSESSRRPSVKEIVGDLQSLVQSISLAS